jgi:hypothetical protein
MDKISPLVIVIGMIIIGLLAWLVYIQINKQISDEQPMTTSRAVQKTPPSPTKNKHRAVCVIAKDNTLDMEKILCIPTLTDKSNPNQPVEIHPLSGEIANRYNSYKNLNSCYKKVRKGKSMCTNWSNLNPNYYKYWTNYYVPYRNGQLCYSCVPHCDHGCNSVNIYLNGEDGVELEEPVPDIEEPVPDIEEPVPDIEESDSDEDSDSDDEEPDILLDIDPEILIEGPPEGPLLDSEGDLPLEITPAGLLPGGDEVPPLLGGRWWSTIRR